MKAKNKSAYHWVILVCCILTLMFAYSTRVSLAQLFSTEILKETGFQREHIFNINDYKYIMYHSISDHW